MKEILSKNNETIKQIKKLNQNKFQKKANAFLIETPHLIDEAIKFNAKIINILVMDEYLDKYLQYDNEFEVIKINRLVADYLSETITPQGVFAVIEIDDSKLKLDVSKKVLVLDDVQDPGNVGTLIRTADAAGFDAVLATKGSANVYLPKVIRAMQGSNFHVPVFQLSSIEILSLLKRNSFKIYASALNNDSISYKEITKSGPIAIVVGNEGNGVTPEMIDNSDEIVKIPMLGQAESLNVAVAGGILMFSLL